MHTLYEIEAWRQRREDLTREAETDRLARQQRAQRRQGRKALARRLFGDTAHDSPDAA